MSINIQEFVQNFADQFENPEIPELTISTVFRDIDEWSSLTLLSIIAMIDEEYGIKLTGDDIRNSNTIEDIYSIVKSKTI